MVRLLPLLGCSAVGLFAVASCGDDTDDLEKTVQSLDQRLQALEQTVHQQTLYDQNLASLREFVATHPDLPSSVYQQTSPRSESQSGLPYHRLSLFREWSRTCLDTMTDIVCGGN